MDHGQFHLVNSGGITWEGSKRGFQLKELKQNPNQVPIKPISQSTGNPHIDSKEPKPIPCNMLTRHSQSSQSSIINVETSLEKASHRDTPAKILEVKSTQDLVAQSRNTNLSPSLGTKEGLQGEHINNHRHHAMHSPPQINNDMIEGVKINVPSPQLKVNLIPTKATRVC